MWDFGKNGLSAVQRLWPSYELLLCATVTVTALPTVCLNRSHGALQRSTGNAQTSAAVNLRASCRFLQLFEPYESLLRPGLSSL